MRTFIALALPAAVQSELMALQRALRVELAARPEAESLRWAAPDKMHLTLRFLGETSAEERARVQAELETLSQRQFQVAWQGLGAFPTWARIAVLWAGLCGAGNGVGQDGSAESEALARLQADVEQRVRRAGLPPEKKAFRPHLTLARSPRHLTRGERRALGGFLRQWNERRAPAGSAWTVAEILYLQSQLHATGARYTVLARQRLAP